MFAQKWDKFASLRTKGLESYTPLNYGDFMWIFGGQQFGNVLNDKVYKSKTGYLWEEVVPNPEAVSPNVMHPGFTEGDAAVFNGKMVLVGGLDDSSTVMATVLASTDGINWVKGTDLTAAVHKHRVVVYAGELYQVGGTTDGTTPLEKVYKSADADAPGGSWAQVGVDILPAPLMSFSMAEWNGRFWVAGGITTAAAYSKKMYSTTDLLTDWAEEGTDASPEVQNAVLIPMGDRMYLVGGETASGPSRKVYVTEDGINWVDLGDKMPFGSEYRAAFRQVKQLNNKRDVSAFIFAGTTLRDDVYESKLDFNPFGWRDVTLPRHWEVTATNGTWVGDHWEPKDNGATFDLQLAALTGSTWATWKRPTAMRLGISQIGASPGAIGVDIQDAGAASIGADANYNHDEIVITFGGADDLDQILIDLDVTYQVDKIELYYPERPL
jgi:hypothetical protein